MARRSEREKQTFVEQQLAFGWIAQQTKTKHEATHEDMLAYYLEHIEDYSFSAKARWEELRVRTTNLPEPRCGAAGPGRNGQRCVAWGEFRRRGASQIARADGANGGQYDWTTQGSLASDLIDEAIFKLPIGRMSQILDDGRSADYLHRARDRTQRGRPTTLYRSAGRDQGKARSTPITKRTKLKLHEYVEKLRAETPIWTIYDDQPDAQANAQNQGGQNGAGPVNSTSLRPAGPAGGKSQPTNPYLRCQRVT